MCICMYCMYLYVYADIYVCMYVCMNVCAYICMLVLMYAESLLFFLPNFKCRCTCAYVCMHADKTVHRHIFFNDRGQTDSESESYIHAYMRT